MNMMFLFVFPIKCLYWHFIVTHGNDPHPLFQINIVGVKRLGNLETCTVEDLDVALNGCVRSTFIVCKEAIPELIKTKGAIVNMSSVSGIRAVSIDATAEKFVNFFLQLQ